MCMLLGHVLFLTLPPRESPSRAICRSQLKGIGTALSLYSECETCRLNEEEEEDKTTLSPIYPSNLDALVHEGFASEKCFTCPSAKHKASWNSKFSRDYVYCFCSQPKFQTDSWKILPVMFEIPINHNQNIAGMIFNNGDVEQIDDMDEFRLQIQTINETLLHEMGIR